MPDIGYGITLFVSDAAPAITPINAVAKVTSFTPPNPTRDVIDVTSAASLSTTREFIVGMIDNGEAGFELIWDIGDTTDVLLRGIVLENKPRTWKVTFAQKAGSPSITFLAFLTGYERAVPIEDKMTATVTLKVTGAPVYA